MRAMSLVLLLAVPSIAQAQTRWRDHARVSINFGIQPSSTSFDSTTTKPVYVETSTINTTYALNSGRFFDGGVVIRVAGGLGVGAAVSSFSKDESASITGSIPHPFFFNMPRAISGTSSALQRSETAVHIQVAYVISSKRFNVAVTGGPTFFNVSQDLVADVTYTETYPYDTATFSGATISKASETKLGFNAGADIGYKLSKNFGVGGLIRFSRASVTFPLANSVSGVGADIGGLQAGGGVRLFF